ncbi:phosphoadenosine phosphosulfate reductase family protein [Cuniculiplasma sp. SKW4]|uniref:phosphoadenosine phosphosulfate reductase family protein n=1 Tax=Cuniculiplasma sp. SKW4 TaxID=3400171 RepID=UPI003FD228D6
MYNNKVEETVQALLHFDQICNGKEFLLSSFSKEDMIILDLMIKNDLTRDVYTIDTGMLNQETYSFIHSIRREYNLKIKFLFPNSRDVEEMLNTYGPNLFYESVEKREMCCNVRKVMPLKKLLDERSDWITGIRSEQTLWRRMSSIIEIDKSYRKCNPLLKWTLSDVDQYVDREKNTFKPTLFKGL